MTPPTWSIQAFQGRHGLRQLRGEWERLQATLPGRALHHTYEGYQAYLDHLSETPEALVFFTLSDGHQVRAICPLEPRVERVLRLPVRVWRFPRHPHWPFSDVVCLPDEARDQLLATLVGHLRRRGSRRSMLVLGGVTERSAAWQAIRRVGAGPYHARSVGESSLLDCDRSMEDFTSKLSKNFRRNLRSRRDKLSTLADVRWVTARDSTGLPGELAAFLQVESSGWKGEFGTRSAIRLHPRLQAFYRDLTESFGAAGACEINSLYADGHCIAGQFCLRTSEEYVIYKIGFDERYAGVAPGQLLMQRTLERCCQDPGIRRVNLVTYAAWNHDWRTDSVPVYQVYLAIDRALARLIVALLRFRGRMAASARAEGRGPSPGLTQAGP